MGAERLPYLLARAREWWAAVDELRAAGVADGDPVLTVWREAAWCHLLLIKGLYGAAVARLRGVFRDVTGANPPDLVTRPECEADVLIAATALFDRLRSVVALRHPTAFDRPVAA